MAGTAGAVGAADAVGTADAAETAADIATETATETATVTAAGTAAEITAGTIADISEGRRRDGEDDLHGLVGGIVPAMHGTTGDADAVLVMERIGDTVDLQLYDLSRVEECDLFAEMSLGFLT